MSIDLDKQLLLELAIKNVLNAYFENVTYNGVEYNFRCNVCGDGSKKFNKRGHIYTNGESWHYYCFNGDCHGNYPAEYWLKDFFPLEYEDVLRDYARLKMTNSKKKEVIIDNYKFKSSKIKFKIVDEIDFDEKKEVSHFRPLTNYPKLLQYCAGRLIPEEEYSRWYYCEKGFYRNRIIIPFFNNMNSIYYYQGRDLKPKSKCKYLSRVGKELNCIYNYYNVDIDLPVPIIEGPIDSIFTENSVAITGLKDKTDLLNKFKYKRYLFDNDKSGKMKSLQLLLGGQYIFNWKMFLTKYPCVKDVKDVNDFIKFNQIGIRFLTWELIEPFFTNNIHHRIFFVTGNKKK